LFGVDRSFQAIVQGVYRLSECVPDPPLAKPMRVAVDETAVTINGEWSWLYAAIDVDTKLLLDVEVFSRPGTDPAAAFLHRLREKHDPTKTVVLVDQFGYRTALFRLGLNGRVDYLDRTIIETWFHTLKMRVDRFHSSWVGGRSSVRRWIVQFVRYDTVQRPTGHSAVERLRREVTRRRRINVVIKTVMNAPTPSGNVTKVDSKGRIVLPKELRERLGITPGTEVDVHEEDGKAVVEPEDDPERIIERMDQLVAETSSERGETTPLDEGADPIAQKHREATRRGAGEDSDGRR
jgi:putative transposase